MGREQELLEAARTGNVAAVEKLLASRRGLGSATVQALPGLLTSIWRGPAVNCVDSSGYTPLHHAALNGHKEVVLRLLQHEASTNVADAKGCFPLHLAAWRGDADIVRILIEHGPSRSPPNQQIPSEKSEVKRHGPFDPYVNAKNHDNETALHCAAQYGHTAVVRLLLEELTDPTMRNTRFETPLDLAALYGRLDVVTLLTRSHPNLLACNTKQHTPLHLAARNGHTGTVQVLLEAGMDVNIQSEKGSALHEAALFGRVDVVRLLLEAGINVNIRDKQSKTALDILGEHRSQKALQISALLRGESADHWPKDKSASARPMTEVVGEQHKRVGERRPSNPEQSGDFLYESLCNALSNSSTSLDHTDEDGLSKQRTRPPPPANPPPEEEADTEVDMSGVSAQRRSSARDEGCDIGWGGNENPYELLASAESRGLLPTLTLDLPPSKEELRDLSSPDYSPPSPDTAVHNIQSVIRPQPRQRKSLFGVTEKKGDELGGSGTLGDEKGVVQPSRGGKNPCSGPVEPPLPLPGREWPNHSDVPVTLSQSSLSRQAAVSNQANFPVEFAGLLHGSSQTARVQADLSRGSPRPLADSASSGPCTAARLDQLNANTASGKCKNGHPVTYKTVFHTLVNQAAATAEGTSVFHSLGRTRSPRCLVELELTRNISKSDSDLLVMPSESAAHNGKSCSEDEVSYERRGGGWGNARRGGGRRGPLRTPSFTKEWEEIDNIMSSIDAGITKETVPRNISHSGGAGGAGGRSSVGQWLDALGLPQYEAQLLANGYDDLNFVGNAMEDQDLLEIGILNSGHRQKVLNAARLLPKVRRAGSDLSVAEWLDSLDLSEYLKNFTMNGYSSMDQVRKLWEIELVNVLKIGLTGHRKRILASLGERYEDPAHKSRLGNQLDECSEPPLVLRPPHEATTSAPVQQWQHQPDQLILRSCNYEAFYMGSMLVKDLRGTDSTHEACAKMRKSTEDMKKIPTITLSITYKGVKFIDASNKNTIAEHEIRNISCAAQDPEDLCTFAYITKDLKTSYHYCHVFSAFDVNLAYEIILTLGQAFEVAYQLALQGRKAKGGGGGGSGGGDVSEGPKASKPIPKPRSIVCKSSVEVVEPLHGGAAWMAEQPSEHKKPAGAKYETTIF
uniref:Ankyrin repeat and SAM domain-containing protein 1A isoform X1 n=1 Tax=Petromyzon marinus TaxID=7757 RepID=A0AAJ7X9R6_PETMA|nr:ankyrin repeat and SAM domain-containing protein 1A isoform X1 [Petromyzon marinus]